MTTTESGVHRMVLHRQMDAESLCAPERAAEERWATLAYRLERGDREAWAELYSEFSRGVRFGLCRHLGPQDLDDRVHDVFLVVVEAIQRGELRERAKLPGFIRTIARRHVATVINGLVQQRREMLDLEEGEAVADDRHNAERDLLHTEQFRVMRNLLGSLSERDRQVLTRFYLDGQSVDQICEEMGLTEGQFRLLKSRAKARFSEVGRKRMLHQRLTSMVTGAVALLGRANA